MCGRPETEAERNASDREKLQHAIERLERHHFCEDAQIALAAARKHLATLPCPPPRKVTVKLSARINERGEVIHTWASAGGDYAYPPIGSRRVELSGEYTAS